SHSGFLVARYSVRDRRVWSRPESAIGTLCHPCPGPMTEFAAGPEGLAIPDMPKALVGDGCVDDRICDRAVPHEGLQGPGINASPRKGISYKPDNGHASRLASNGNIQSRIAELQGRPPCICGVPSGLSEP